MKKILFIAYLYPPRPGIGSQRPYCLSKYFPENGWHPVVLTARLPGPLLNNTDVVETDYVDLLNTVKEKIGFSAEKGIHGQLGLAEKKNHAYSTWKSKLIKFFKEAIAYPDEQRGWFRHALKSGSEILKNDKFDCIISTSYPVTAHLIARQLKHQFGIPWIADLRDPWSQNPYVNKHPFIRYIEKHLELRTLSDADVLVTVTDTWIQTFRELHHNKPVYCITNGFDKDDYPATDIQLTKKFTITHTGILYNGKRDPSLLFNALSQLIDEKKVEKEILDIRFYGPVEDWLLDEVTKYGLKGVVHFHGELPRQDILLKQKESQILLLLTWDNEKEAGFCPAKLYEYFGARRPIIATGWRKSVVKQMLEKTDSGRFARDVNDLKSVLLEYYEEFSSTGTVGYNGNDNIETYSYKSIARKYARLLDNIIQNGK